MQIPFGLIRAFGTMIVASSAVWGAQSLQMWIDLPKGLAGFLILVLTMLVIIPLQVVGEGAKVDSVDTTLVGVAKKRPK